MGKLLLPGLSPPLSNTPDPTDKNKEENVGQAENQLPFYSNAGSGIRSPMFYKCASLGLALRLVCKLLSDSDIQPALKRGGHEWFSQLSLRDGDEEPFCTLVF